MRKNRSAAHLKMLSSAITRQGRVTFSGERIEPTPCNVSPTQRCTRVACETCVFVPSGVWACTLCTHTLREFTRILPYYGDAPCHYCGALPLLSIRLEDL